MEIPLVDLEPGKEGIIASIEGGFGLKRRIRSIGLREGKNLRVIASHPFGGPIVVEVDGREISIGRGMAMKIFVEIK
ncbi:MAG: ferrous iron transport protein A [Thermoplasmatales archaeon]|nr:ferrous iron transport protein A [Thermoplasmatales archaeon]